MRGGIVSGEQPEAVIAAIARFRRGTKHDVQYYAELTVRKAVQSLDRTARQESSGPDRVEIHSPAALIHSEKASI
jgi:hypothetical protein